MSNKMITNIVDQYWGDMFSDMVADGMVESNDVDNIKEIFNDVARDEVRDGPSEPLAMFLGAVFKHILNTVESETASDEDLDFVDQVIDMITDYGVDWSDIVDRINHGNSGV